MNTQSALMILWTIYRVSTCSRDWPLTSSPSRRTSAWSRSSTSPARATSAVCVPTWPSETLRWRDGGGRSGGRLDRPPGREALTPAARSLCPPSPADDGVPEGAEEAAEPALPPADLQAAGGGDERPRARLPADEGLQADDQGTGEEAMMIIILIITTIIHFMLKAKLKKRKKDFYWSSARRLQLCVAAKWVFFLLLIKLHLVISWGSLQQCFSTGGSRHYLDWDVASRSAFLKRGILKWIYL